MNTRMCTSGTTTSHVKCFAAVVAGFSLLYAVCVVFFYSTLLYGIDAQLVGRFDAAFNPSMVLACAAVACFAWLRPAPATRRVLFAVGYVALLAALLLMLVAATGSTSHFVIPCAILAAAGIGLLVPLFFEVLSRFKRRGRAYGCAITYLAGMVIAMGVGALPVEIATIACVILLVGSLVCLARAGALPASPSVRLTCAAAHRQQPACSANRPAVTRDLLDTFLVPGVCTFALSVVYGIMDTLAIGAAPSPEMSVLISQVGGIVAPLAFLLYFGRRCEPSSALPFNAVFGILATGILFLPFLPDGYAMVLNACTAAGWKLVMLTLFYLVIDTYAGRGSQVLVAISLAYALPRLGLFAGLTAAGLVGVGAQADFAKTVAIAFFCLYAVLMVIWMVNARERKRAQDFARRVGEEAARTARDCKDDRRRQSDTVARAHGLTEREAEVLYLIAQGRDTDFIADECHLTKNTVKSYRKSIYFKLGVHSRQEIIDLVAGT